MSVPGGSACTAMAQSCKVTWMSNISTLIDSKTSFLASDAIAPIRLALHEMQSIRTAVVYVFVSPDLYTLSNILQQLARD